MFRHLHRLLALTIDRRAVTALEYGLIAAVVGSVIAVGFGIHGTALKAALASLTV